MGYLYEVVVGVGTEASYFAAPVFEILYFGSFVK